MKINTKIKCKNQKDFAKQSIKTLLIKSIKTYKININRNTDKFIDQNQYPMLRVFLVVYSLFRSNLFYETSSFPFGFFYIPKFKAFFVRSKRFFSARNIAKSHCIQTRAFFFVVFFSFVLPYLSMKHQLLLGSWLLGFSASRLRLGISASRLPPPFPGPPLPPLCVIQWPVQIKQLWKSCKKNGVRSMH